MISQTHRVPLLIILVCFMLIVVMILVALVLGGESSHREPPIVWHTEIVDHTVVINHPRPNLSVDGRLLEDMGCPILDEESSRRYCGFDEVQDPLAALGCLSAMTPNPLLGGLEPSYPMAYCLVTEPYLYRQGCMLDGGAGYVIARDGKYELIVSESELRDVFAPIESEEEALSYALAATGLSAHYETEVKREDAVEIHDGLEFPSGYEYFVEQLEDTHVTETNDGYLVYLFDYALCGCGQHETFAVTVHVTRSGHVRQTYKELVYRDAYEQCID